MKNIILYICAAIFSICLGIIFIYYAFCIPSYSQRFYAYEYEKNGTYEILGIEKDQLMIATTEMMDYLKDEREDLNVTVQIDGTPTEFYNEKEKIHMVDVKNQYENGKDYRNIAFVTALLMVFIFYITKTNGWRMIARTNQFVFSGYLAITAALGIFALFDFNRIFTLFHEIFYDNDFWLLDPSTSRLINMMPPTFFIDIVIFIVTIFVFCCLSTIVLSSFYIKKTKK